MKGLLKRVVVAMDSFKGCLSSIEAGMAVREGVLAVAPDCDVAVMPVADGGEGTLDAINNVLSPEVVTLDVHDPLMRRIRANYLISKDGGTAFIEMAAAAGLPLLRPEERNPKLTTTYGVGEMICHAVSRGCRRIYIGLGGSATNDVGIGMLSALGYRFYDGANNEILSVAGGALSGEDLLRIHKVETTDFTELKDVEFIGVCDVRNPLQGDDGATNVFAPQKGADFSMIMELNKGVANFICALSAFSAQELCRSKPSQSNSSQSNASQLNNESEGHHRRRIPGNAADSLSRNLPGGGAAGGLGFALAYFLGAELKSGIEMVLDLIDFGKIISGADLIITGEGRTDWQSMMGKVPGGVLEYGRRAGVPVTLLSGSVADNDEDRLHRQTASGLEKAGFAGLFSIQRGPISLNDSMNPAIAKANIRFVASQIIGLAQAFA